MSSKNNALPWTIKYLPKSKEEVINQSNALLILEDYVQNFKTKHVNKKKKSLIVYGPTGCGKTSCIYAIANNFDCEIVELNASDFRTQKEIDKVVGNAIKQKSLFSKGKIILIDDVDAVSGIHDRGAALALSKIIDISKYPIIMTLMDPFVKKVSALRKKSELIEFSSLEFEDVLKKLKYIAKEEGIDFEESAIKSLARRSGGDLRGAINDFQALSADGKLVLRDLDMFMEREKKETIENALFRIFKTTNANVARDTFNSLDIDINEFMLWVDYNLPKEYLEAEDLDKAYYYLSRADIFNSRIKRRQEWRFIVYMIAFLTAGIAISKKEKNKNKIQYEQTKRLLKIWMANMKYQKGKSIGEKIGIYAHASKKISQKDYLPYIKYIFRKSNSKENLNILIEELDLSQDEVTWLKK